MRPLIYVLMFSRDVNLVLARIPENLFLAYMRLATEGVEFNFNDMYNQTGGDAMGITILASIFIGY